MRAVRYIYNGSHVGCDSQYDLMWNFDFTIFHLSDTQIAFSTISYTHRTLRLSHINLLICSSLFQYSLKFPEKSKQKNIYFLYRAHLANYLLRLCVCACIHMCECVRTKEIATHFFHLHFLWHECVCVRCVYTFFNGHIIRLVSRFFSLGTQCNVNALGQV